MHSIAVFLVAVGVSSLTSYAQAQDHSTQNKSAVVLDDRKDHAIVFEIGAVGDWERKERSVHTGGTFAIELTPIENWVELEIGVTGLAADGGVEIPVDVLLKKPWRFSPGFEFMIGAGPELVHASGRDRGTFWGVETVLDFMFWPRGNVGWYIEPGYEITFRDGSRHHGLGVAAGLLVGR